MTMQHENVSPKLHLYGVPWSRASNCIWMLEEIGVEYELHQIEPKSSELLALNPNGKVPVLVDDGLVMWESMAINLYLAERFKSSLGPIDLAEKALMLQWSFWAENEIDDFLIKSLA